MNQQQRAPIDISNALDIKCEECENETFTQVYFIKRVSALASPSGEEAIVPVQTFSCTKCANINKQFRFDDES